MLAAPFLVASGPRCTVAVSDLRAYSTGLSISWLIAGPDDLDVGRAYLDKLIERYKDNSFTDRDGSVCKIWFSDMVKRSVDECMQLWGGAGYMDASVISRLYTATRLHPIHVGPNEMHKSLMGRNYVRER